MCYAKGQPEYPDESHWRGVELMDNKKLIKIVKLQMKSFKATMKATKDYENSDYDYAFAEGAYLAYEVMLRLLKGEEL
jgi:hypothetical protein